MDYKYNISDPALNTEHDGEPPWRHYALEAFGNSFKELCANALISEIDQDGGEIVTYGLLDARKAVFNEVIILLRNEVRKAGLN